MSTPQERWVPKVHPLSRESGPEDPLELFATPAPGDPDVMLECLVQEFIWMGWGGEELLGLFHDPIYPVLNQLREYFGEDEVRRRVEAVLARFGAVHFRATVVEGDDPGEDEPELIPLSVQRVAEARSQ